MAKRIKDRPDPTRPDHSPGQSFRSPSYVLTVYAKLKQEHWRKPIVTVDGIKLGCNL